MANALSCEWIYAFFFVQILLNSQIGFSFNTDAIFNVTEMVTDYNIPIVEPTYPPNISNITVEDSHVYYNSSFSLSLDKEGKFSWIDLDSKPETITHSLLSESYRRAGVVQLSFDFPFYGHLLRNITIATGGFLYMGNYIHNWIAATQYVAPLMANFDPSLSNISMIKYYDSGTSFTVMWQNVMLKDGIKDGKFTFEVTLFQNGDIAFVYKSIPTSIRELSNESHPVKVGLSDAYLLERTTFFLHKRIIYEYHKIDLKEHDISNNTVLYFTALPTCLNFKDCESCQTSQIGFACMWCEANKRCSDGLDRHRQEWLKSNCINEKNNTVCPNASTTYQPTVPTKMPISTTATTPVTTQPSLSESTSKSSIEIEITTKEKSIIYSSTVQPENLPTTKRTTPSENINTILPFSDSRKEPQKGYAEMEDSGISSGGVFAIILVIVLVLGVGIWVLYAYRYPQSSSGQFLIKYRPSQWHWKRDESRYSASVHM